MILFAPLLLALGQAPAPSATGGQTIVFFSSAEKRVSDESLLVDAVAIYTRDLGLTVVREDDPRLSLSTPASLEGAVATLRARSARLGFWYHLAADNRSLELFTVDARKRMTRQAFTNDGPSVDLYRAIALKIRVLLVSAEPPGRPAPVPPAPPLAALPSPRVTVSPSPSLAASPSPALSPSSPLPSPPPAPTAAWPPPRMAASPSPASPLPGPVASEGFVSAAADRPAPPPRPSIVAERAAEEPEPPAPPSSRRLMVGVGYALSLPSGSASWRHAAVLHATASLRRPVEAGLVVELAPSDSRSGPTGSLFVTDVPLRVGVRLVRRGPSAVLGLGGFAGAHLLFAHALASAPDTATDRTWAVTGAGGVEFMARGQTSGLVPELRVWVEAKAPRTRFLVQGADPRFEAGSLGAGISLGLTYARQ